MWRISPRVIQLWVSDHLSYFSTTSGVFAPLLLVFVDRCKGADVPEAGLEQTGEEDFAGGAGGCRTGRLTAKDLHSPASHLAIPFFPPFYTQEPVSPRLRLFYLRPNRVVFCSLYV
jgi:hypothetical protein